MKASIKDLKYIAFEGGGGKGAVYKGAIQAIEKLLYNEWIEDRLLRFAQDDFKSPSTAELYNQGLMEKEDPYANGLISIFDYTDKDKALKIQGISGASTGSITSFALSLGLKSEDIDTILKSYPFSEEFLGGNALAECKYRMVGTNAENKFQILVAEDDGKKLGEAEIEQFEYAFTQKHQNWIDKKTGQAENYLDLSFIKGKVVTAIRHQIIGVVYGILITGLKDYLGFIKKMVDWLKTKIKDFQLKILSWIFEELDLFMNNDKAATTTNKLLSTIKILHKTALKYFAKHWKLLHVFPLNNNLVPAISNLVWDRGMYAGFEVRDFFANMVLFAISRNANFKRNLVESKTLTKEYLDSLKMSFDDKFKVTIKEGNIAEIETLIRNMTFEQYHSITGINLIITVTNSTTAQPLYFSHYFTPHYPVIEAVGASMSFPLAFKPLYNEADVLHGADNYPAFVQKTNTKKGNIVKLTFDKRKYDIGLNYVLQHVIERCKLHFSLNGNLSFRSFLPYLRAVITKEDFKSDVEGMKNLCYFYYNAAFKGLLNDGGQTDNIPQRIFSLNAVDVKKDGYDDVQSLASEDNVLALKLDNDYDTDVIAAVEALLKQDKGGKLFNKLSELTMAKAAPADSNFHFYWLKLIIQKLKTKRHTKNVFKDLPENKNLYEKISSDIFWQYKKSLQGFTPWNRQTNALSALSNALQFGFDQSAIDNLGLNDKIVSLYCYGLSTFTFDLQGKDIEELVKFANVKSEERVMEYFKE